MTNPRKRRLRRKLIEKKRKVAESLGISVISKELLLALPDEIVVEQVKPEPVAEIEKGVAPVEQESADEEVSVNLKRGRPKKQ